MQSRPIPRFALIVIALLCGLTPFSRAAVQNRITGAVQENQRVALTRTVVPKAARALDLGAAPSSLELKNMTMYFSMTDAQQAALSQLLIDQQNPSSPHYHQWLTPAQFGAQFGLSASDLSAVTSWLTSQGFTITNTAKSSTFVTFSGTVAQVQNAFGTTIHNLSLNGEQHISNLTEPTLPAAIAGVVGSIRGLNDFKLKTHAQKRILKTDNPNPRLSINVCTNNSCSTSEIEHFITPGDFATIYNTSPLLSGSTNGSGITIAVMGQVNLSTYFPDVAAFRTASALSANTPTQKIYGADPGVPTGSCLSTTPPTSCSVTEGDLDESELDVEWAGAAAPSASILFVTSTDVINSLTDAIDDNLAPIMTISYGGCEQQDFGVSDMNSLNAVFEQANAEGITIFGPSGDSGATDCEDNSSTSTSGPSATTGLAVDFPASSPYVTGVGGTEFSEGADTATPQGTYWNNSTATSTNPQASTALSYIPEMVWNDTESEINVNSAQANFSSSGGGASTVFAKPYWQIGTGVPNDFSRDVPDVALSASADHDAYMACIEGSCQGGTYFTSSTGGFSAFGGTSVSTPSFAGIVALVEQKLGGGRLGNINPYIYALANGSSASSVFHDVTAGDNKQPCTVGSTGCTSSPIGFSATTGYDQATGWGSVNAANFAADWGTPLTSATGTALSLTSVVANPTSVTAGTAVQLTIAVTAASSTNTTIPSGTVQIVVDGSVVGTSVALTSGNATYSLSTTSLSSGSHTVAAVYSGDSTFSNSKGSATIDINSATNADFTLTPSTATINVASGGTSSGTTFTVTPTNGFTGTITFTSTGSISATYSVTPQTVTINSSTASAITIYTIQAYVSSSTSNLRSSGLRLASTHTSGLRAPWYAAGSGAVFAGLLLFSLPRRRRWIGLFAVLVSVGILSSAGCGGSSTTSTTSSSGQTNTATGSYPVSLIATGTTTSGTTVTHNAMITVNVQ